MTKEQLEDFAAKSHEHLPGKVAGDD